MFRRGVGEPNEAARFSRPIRHFTALCWVLGIGLERALVERIAPDPAPSVAIAGP